jgi:hypothetical protein
MGDILVNIVSPFLLGHVTRETRHFTELTITE